MTQEEKELLIKDLCARLPYSGVQIHISYEDGFKYDKTLTYEDVKNYSQLPACSTTIVKPYLRPMSSMTEEEKEELRDTYDWVYSEYPFEDEDEDEDDLRNVEDVGGHYEPSAETYDWYNRKGFDYRGLIPKGLALEAKEGMYNN